MYLEHYGLGVNPFSLSPGLDFLYKSGAFEESIAHVEKLAKFDLGRIEEPTSPDDILGHARIAKALRPIRVATGEHRHNRITEYADHLHEHFVHPVVMRGGRYCLPEAPGLGVEFKAESLAEFAFPDGPVWKVR